MSVSNNNITSFFEFYSAKEKFCKHSALSGSFCNAKLHTFVRGSSLRKKQEIARFNFQKYHIRNFPNKIMEERKFEEKSEKKF